MENKRAMRDSSWNVVGKKLNEPKIFNTWAVIDFIGDKISIDQIRDRVHVLSM